MATRKMKKYAEGDVVYEDDPYDDMEIANRRTDRTLVPNERGAAGTSETVFPTEKPMAKPKAGIVTKEELAKSGLSLRDYMNKQQGLTRRGDSSSAGKTLPKIPDAAPDTGDELGRLARFKKPPLRQETMRERAESYNRKRGIPGFKAGGSVSSASKRADGIAIKGKTRGKMC
jgi:hypothetical protein